ncbi:MAG: quinol dehydrogenase ferredoxin subunit NapH [Rhodocyclaceae bacterium]|nr:quinol dehydrogenase ferredoxin subunit NapH [Rhodocyclaceae bacterium]
MSARTAAGSRGKAAPLAPGHEAVAVKGWLGAHKWLLARRCVQFAILALFLAGPWAGLWIVKGNLSSSLTLGTLPLTDPFVLAQSIAARHWPAAAALTGAAIVLLFYAVVGGRVFCSWVCPVNVVTDGAAWLRRRLGIKTGKVPSSATRWWLLGGVLLASAATGMTVWEFVNPVSMTHRALIFGGSAAWLVVIAVFAYDLLVANRGWCGHVCPMGACYATLGRVALLRVSAAQRSACNDCMDCFVVCPEPQVIRPALKAVDGAGPVITFSECTNCGRCIDVCSKNVFRYAHRFDQRSA